MKRFLLGVLLSALGVSWVTGATRRFDLVKDQSNQITAGMYAYALKDSTTEKCYLLVIGPQPTYSVGVGPEIPCQ